MFNELQHNWCGRPQLQLAGSANDVRLSLSGFTVPYPGETKVLPASAFKKVVNIRDDDDERSPRSLCKTPSFRSTGGRAFLFTSQTQSPYGREEAVFFFGARVSVEIDSRS